MGFWRRLLGRGGRGDDGEDEAGAAEPVQAPEEVLARKRHAVLRAEHLDLRCARCHAPLVRELEDDDVVRAFDELRAGRAAPLLGGWKGKACGACRVVYCDDCVGPGRQPQCPRCRGRLNAARARVMAMMGILPPRGA